MIILAPTKTNKDSDIYKSSKITTKSINKTEELVNKISSFSYLEFQKVFKIKNKTLDTTYEYYQNFDKNKSTFAILKYEGLVFRQIKDLENKLEDKSYQNYINNRVYIISTLYGLINGLDYIKSYRLDFTLSKVLGSSLYKYWEEEVNQHIIDLKPLSILNLASQEYSKIIKKQVYDNIPVYNIKSMDKTNSTMLKKIRGEVLNYCLDNQTENYEQLVGVKLNLITFIKIENNDLIFEIN